MDIPLHSTPRFRYKPETLEDEVLATALLDRLLYRCEVVKLSEASYRMENRKNILPENK